MPTKQLTLAKLTELVPTDEAAYTWFESIIWPNGPVCPHCGVINHAYHLKPKDGERKTRTGNTSQRKLWKCGACRKQFTVTVGTCMERSKIPVRKWAMAFHMLAAGKNGVSSHELGRTLGISHESAWFMTQRIRYAFSDVLNKEPLTGTVEADETYVGGLAHVGPHGRRWENKTPVVTLVERDGRARSRVMPSVTAKNIRDHLWTNVHPDAELITDDSKLYDRSGWVYKLHATVNHSQGEYVRGTFHTNTVEGFFSQLKRSLDGTHHHVSPEHLHRYVGEFDFRYNTRKMNDGERTERAIQKSVGKRLTYRQTTGKD